MTSVPSLSGIDLGIVVTDGEAALRFYRDVLGFAFEGENPLPGGGRMFRLRCGSSMIKLAVPATPPAPCADPGELWARTGYRYFTVTISALDAILRRCTAAGHAPVLGPVEVAPGMRIAMVADPDGNRVEFFEIAVTD